MKHCIQATFVLLAALSAVRLHAAEISEKAINAIYAHDRYKPEVRKVVYKLMKIQTAIYESENGINSHAYVVPEYNKSSDQIQRWVPMKQEQVINMARSQAELDVNGTSPGFDKFVNTASKWASLFPGTAGSSAALAITSLGEAYKIARPGKIPSLEDVKLPLGEALRDLSLTHPEIVAEIMKDYEKASGYSIEDAANHPVMKEIANIRSSQDAFAKIEGQLQRVLDAQGKFKKILEAQAKSRPAADAARPPTSEEKKDADLALYKKSKEEVLGNIAAVGSALGYLGDSKAAETVGKFEKIVGLSMDLDKFQNTMNPLMLANSYLTIANIAMSLFSSNGGGADRAMMETLSKILQEVQTLKAEMHNRFDQIDEKMAELMDQMIITDALNRDREFALLDNMHKLEKLFDRNLNEKVDGATKAITYTLKIENLEQDCLGVGIERPGEKNYSNEELPLVCINPLHTKATGRALNLSPAPYRDVQWGRNMERPFEKYFPTILKAISEVDTGHPVIREETWMDVIDHERWGSVTDIFLKVFDKYHQKNPVFVGEDFTYFREGANQLLSLRRNMLVENKRLRWSTINAFLAKYQKLVTATALEAKSRSKSPKLDGKAIPGNFDISQPLTQPSNFFFKGDARKLAFCDGNKNGGIHQAKVNIDSSAERLIGRDALRSWQIEMIPFQLPDQFETILPNEFRWLAQKYPKQTKICIERIAIPLYQHTVKITDPSALVAIKTPSVKYSADVRINFVYNNKILSTGVFKGNFSITGSEPYRPEGWNNWVFYFYRQIWTGLSSKNMPSHWGNYKINVPGIFSDLQSHKDAFTKGINKTNYDTAMKDVKAQWLDGEDKNAIDHFVGAIYSSEIDEVNGLLNVFRGAVFLGINDRLEEKRSIEETFGENAMILIGGKKVPKLGLIHLDKLIEYSVKYDWTPEQISARIQVGVDTMTEAFRLLDESGKDPTPEVPSWINERLIELKIRQNKLSQLNQTVENNPEGSVTDKIGEKVKSLLDWLKP